MTTRIQITIHGTIYRFRWKTNSEGIYTNKTRNLRTENPAGK
jgi:hypothetical protein